MESVLAEQDVIKREAGVLRQLVEKSGGSSRDTRERQQKEERGGDGDDDARSIRTIVPHGLEWVNEEDEDQIAGQEQQRQERQEGEQQPRPEETERRRRVELGRPKTTEPVYDPHTDG